MSLSISHAFQYLKFVLFHALNPCYFMSQTLRYDDHLRGQRDRRGRDVFDLLTRDVSVRISCFSMSQMHAIRYLKCWWRIVIRDIKESEENAMFWVYLHAISQSVSHAIACLKCMLFDVSNVDVGSPLERSERAKRTGYF